MDHTVRAMLHSILRRECRSLFQYHGEIPAWTGVHDQNVFARMRELAAAESDVTEGLLKLLQKRDGGTVYLGPFPDYTSYNDAALHFLLPIIVREQKGLLSQLDRDRLMITDAEAGPLLDQLISLKRQHIQELESLHTAPHSVTAIV